MLADACNSSSKLSLEQSNLN